MDIKSAIYKKLHKNKKTAVINVLGNRDIELFFLSKNDKVNYLKRRIENMAPAYKELLKEEIESIYTEKEGPFIVVGALTSPTGEKMTEETVFIQNPLQGKEIIPVDLSGLENYSVFNGQVVAMRCERTNDKTLKVFNLYILPMIEINNQNKGPLDIVVTRGSITDAIMDRLLTDGPEVIAILGPFYKPGEFETFAAFVSFLKNKLKKNPHSQIILVPSIHDEEFSSFFPQAAIYLGEDRIKCVSNPSTISINGHMISFNNFDVIRDISGDELCKETNKEIDKLFNGDRLRRITYHMAFQRTFCPSVPSIDTVSYTNDLSMNVCPDIYVTASVFNDFHLKAGPCEIINMGNNPEIHYRLDHSQGNYIISRGLNKTE